MPKTTKSVLIAFAALSIAATGVNAETGKKRKPGFFERLFTVDQSKRKKPKRQQGNFFTWLDRDNDSGVNVIYGDGASKRRFNDADPEPLPGKGMGNLTYSPPKLVVLASAAVAKVPAYGLEADAIKQLLLKSKNNIRTTAKDRDVIVAHYQATGFKPLWLSQGKLTERATKLLSLFETAGADGLTPSLYLPSQLTSFGEVSTSRIWSGEDAAALELGLTASALTYGRHLYGGQLEPNRLSLYHDIQPDALEPATMLRVLAYSPFPENYLQSLTPGNAEYAVLKSGLKLVREEKAKQQFIPFESTGKRVRIGQRDNRIPELRRRMMELAHIDPGEALVASDKRELLDKALSNGLKKFQQANGIKATGNLDRATEIVLSANPLDRQEQKLIANLERIRWLPKDLGARHVFVNQAAFEATVRNNGKAIWQTRVIVGKPLTQTYVFSDQFEQVVFNPSWGVPQSIIVNEYLPKLRRDPGYLDRIGFKVVNASGKVIPSRAVDWWAYGNKVPLGVQQPPGGENALGEIKFLFPNGHDIYMHDTPTRDLFDREVRAFSHGCVRVKDPREFASVLLGWDRAKVDSMVDSGESTTTKVSAGYRVHLQYLTAWPDAEGKIQYYSDIYARDEALLKGLEILRDPSKAVTRISMTEGQSGRKKVVLPD